MTQYSSTTTASSMTQSSSASYDDFDDDAWAAFDLSGAIDQHERCSGSQPAAVATASTMPPLPMLALPVGMGNDGIHRDQEWLDITRTELRCGELMKVVASAGAGKSTVLREYAALRPHLRCLYLTFNKEVRGEKQAEFIGAGLRHVTVKTVNSLAWGPTLPYHQKVLSQGDFFLNATHLEQLTGGRVASLEDTEAIKAALCCFCASTDAEVARHHLPGKVAARDAARLVDMARQVRALPLPPPPLPLCPPAAASSAASMPPPPLPSPHSLLSAPPLQPRNPATLSPFTPPPPRPPHPPHPRRSRRCPCRTPP